MTFAPPSRDWLPLAVSFVGGLVTQYTAQLLVKRNSRKVLSWEYAVGALASVDGTFSNDVEIRFNGQKVEDARSLTVTVRNIGPTYIDALDFKDDMKLILPGSSAIIQIRASASLGKFVQPKVLISDDKRVAGISIKPLLINAGEQFALFALVSGFNDEVTFTARVAGGQLIRKGSGGVLVDTSDLLGLALGLCLAAKIVDMLLVHLHLAAPPSDVQYIVGVLLLCFLSLVIVYNVAKRKSSQ